MKCYKRDVLAFEEPEDGYDSKAMPEASME